MGFSFFPSLNAALGSQLADSNLYTVNCAIKLMSVNVTSYVIYINHKLIRIYVSPTNVHNHFQGMRQSEFMQTKMDKLLCNHIYHFTRFFFFFTIY